MPRRQDRVPVVFDTNVLVAHYLSRRADSACSRLMQLWRQRRLQMVLSEPLQAEYLEALERVQVQKPRIERLRQRLRQRATVSLVRLGQTRAVSRDSDDDFVLATAESGKAELLVTNDRDLLDLPKEQQRLFRFRIVTPGAALAELSSRK